jgi:MFS family permease
VASPISATTRDDRWLVLAVVGLAQLMVVLDGTIVNIALPSTPNDLGFSDDNRQWIIIAHALAFGSLLLLGGTLLDIWGRKTTFIVGLQGFAAASVLGGPPDSFELLVAARASQGALGELRAPAALSILTTTFTEPRQRGKAFGIYVAVAGSGSAVGLGLGGALTEYASWRWYLFVNVAFAKSAPPRPGPELPFPARSPSPLDWSRFYSDSRTPRSTDGTMD